MKRLRDEKLLQAKLSRQREKLRRLIEANGLSTIAPALPLQVLADDSSAPSNIIPFPVKLSRSQVS